MFVRLLADTASSSCPAHPGYLAKTSITLAAVICEADDICSVRTAYAPESFFYISSEHHSSYVFLVLWFQLRILKMTGVHQCNKVDFLFLCVCIQNIILLALHFVHLPSKDFLELLPILDPLQPCIVVQNLHRLLHWKKFMHQSAMSQRVEPFLRECARHDSSEE